MKKIIGIVVSIISVIVIFMRDVLVNVISTKIENWQFEKIIKGVGESIKNFFTNIFGFTIPLWVILLVIGSIYAIYTVLKYIKRITSTERNNKEFKWDKYKCEEYEGLKYTWEYESYLGERKIKNLRPICKCGCDLVQKYYNMREYLVCPNCAKKYENNFLKNREAVEKLIIYNYNKMVQDYNNKIDNCSKVNLKDLTKAEKVIIDKFFNKNIKKFISKKVPIDGSKFNDEIDSLIERKILKNLNEYEIIENYTSGGVLYELTEEAIEVLNKNY